MHERRETILTAVFLTTCLALVVVGLWPRLHVRRSVPVPEVPDLVVAVHGAVRTAGSYRLPWGARVADLVEAAGGLGPDAASELVDLAAPLTHGTTVHVPRLAGPEGEVRVSINAASVRELQTLPGIGPALAGRIVEARPFASIDDLERVRGIGPATLARLRSRVAP